MSVSTLDGSPVESLHVARSKIDKNLATMIDPTIDGICPNGMTQPVMVKVFPINQNLVLANGVDLVIVWSPESATQTQGQLFTVDANGTYRYAGDVKASVDLTSYSEAMTVSSVLVVFSDTVSTTTVVLSGRVSSIGMFSVLSIRPTWDTMGKYVSDPKASMINVSLAEGVVCLQCPNPKKIMHQVNTLLGHSKDYYMSQAPIGTVTIPTNNNTWNPVFGETEIDLGLHALSGKYPVFLSLNPTSMNTPAQGHQLASKSMGWDHTQSNLLVRCYMTTGAMTIIALDMNYDQWTIVPPTDTYKVAVQGNLVVAPGDADVNMVCGGPLVLSAFSGNPLTADSASMKYIIYIQGNIGDKNINISGWTRYEMIPSPENMQLATYRRILAYNPMTFEAFQVLLDQLDFFKLCTSRQGYAQMLKLIPYLTLGEVGELADNAASASLALAPLIRGFVSKLKQVGINPASLMKKATSGLHRLADSGVEKLEQLGFAQVGYASSEIGTPYITKLLEDDDVLELPPVRHPLTVTCGYSAATPIGFPSNPYGSAASGECNYEQGFASLQTPQYGASDWSVFQDLADETTPAEVAPSQGATTVEVKLTKQNVVFSEEMIQKTIDCTFKSSRWKKFVNGDKTERKADDLCRASFFFMVGLAPEMVKGQLRNIGKSIPGALTLTTYEVPGHKYAVFGNWRIDACIDDTEKEEGTGLTSLDKAKLILLCPEIVGPLRSLIVGHSDRSLKTANKLYLSIHMGHSDLKILKDVSYTGALYAAIHSENPLCIYEAACMPFGISADGKLRGVLANWATPSQLAVKLSAAMFPLSDGFFANLAGFYQEYVPAVVLSSANAWNQQIVTELSRCGVSYINNISSGMRGLVDLISDMSFAKKPPFDHRKYVKIVDGETVDISAMRSDLDEWMSELVGYIQEDLAKYPNLRNSLENLVTVTNSLSKDELAELSTYLKKTDLHNISSDEPFSSTKVLKAARQYMSLMMTDLNAQERKLRRAANVSDMAERATVLSHTAVPKYQGREKQTQTKAQPVVNNLTKFLTKSYGTKLEDE